MLPAEGNTPSAGIKARALHRFLMGGKPIPKNKVRGGNGIGGGTGTTAAPTSGHQQGAKRGSIGWSALTEAMESFGPAAITQEFLENF